MLENKYDINIQQGSSYDLMLIVKDADNNLKDLTDHSAKMQIRSSYSSSTPLIDVSTDNGGITIDASNSTILIQMTAANTANIKVDLNKSVKPPYSVYVYDLEMTDSIGKTSKLMYGDVTVYGEVTR
mgnify:CR=1 FL=1